MSQENVELMRRTFELTLAGEKLIELRTIPDHAKALEAAGHRGG